MGAPEGGAAAQQPQGAVAIDFMSLPSKNCDISLKPKLQSFPDHKWKKIGHYHFKENNVTFIL